MNVPVYFDMVGGFGLDYKPWEMLWSIPQGLFSREHNVPGFFGHVLYQLRCFEEIFGVNLVADGRNILRNMQGYQ